MQKTWYQIQNYLWGAFRGLELMICPPYMDSSFSAFGDRVERKVQILLHFIQGGHVNLEGYGRIQAN